MSRIHLTRPARVAATFVAGLAFGVVLSLTHTGQHAVAAEKDAPDLAALRAEVERLKGLVPDQSHAMSMLATTIPTSGSPPSRRTGRWRTFSSARCGPI